MNVERMVELIAGLLIGAAMFNVFFTSSQTSGVVGAVGSNTANVLGVLTAKGSG